MIDKNEDLFMNIIRVEYGKKIESLKKDEKPKSADGKNCKLVKFAYGYGKIAYVNECAEEEQKRSESEENRDNSEEVLTDENTDAKKEETKNIYVVEEGKTIYLTFDDGPLDGTGNLLSTLKEEGIRATLFVVGKHAVKNMRTLKRAKNTPGIFVANHTYSHANGHYRDFYGHGINRVLKDVDRAEKIVKGSKYMRLCGRNVWRLPHFRRNDTAIKPSQRAVEIAKYDALESHGYRIYGWDIEWGFNHKTQRSSVNAEEMVRRISRIHSKHQTVKKDKVVLLAHDFMWRSPKAVAQLREFIGLLKSDGWGFDTIDHYGEGDISEEKEDSLFLN